MKKTILLVGALAVSAVSQARTWTSANGENTFEADYLSNDANTVTVLRNGKKVIFKIELLSKEDRTWIEAEAKKQSKPMPTKKPQRNFPKATSAKLLGKCRSWMERNSASMNWKPLPSFSSSIFQRAGDHPAVPVLHS